MKKAPLSGTVIPSEDDIREYACHLYRQAGWAPGHELDNWFGAEAFLSAEIPPARSHPRRDRHSIGSGKTSTFPVASAAKGIPPRFSIARKFRGKSLVCLLLREFERREAECLSEGESKQGPGLELESVRWTER